MVEAGFGDTQPLIPPPVSVPPARLDGARGVGSGSAPAPSAPAPPATYDIPIYADGKLVRVETVRRPRE